jgi:hypothetical protein
MFISNGASARIGAAALAVAGLCAGLGCAAAVAVACGDEPGSPPAPPAAAAARPALGAPPVPGKPAVLYEVWHVRDGRLYRVHRQGAGDHPAPLARVLRELMDGPWREELDAGLSSEATPYDRLEMVSVRNGLATVRAEPKFFRINPTQLNLRLGQVVFTLTQYRSIRRVRFVSRAFAPDRDFTRRSFRWNLPRILVDTPRGGVTAGSPLAVAGSASVRDAIVVRVLDGAGAEIARAATTPTTSCGRGCRGGWAATLRYAVDRTQTGTVEVSRASASDATPRDVVAIPVRLAR